MPDRNYDVDDILREFRQQEDPSRRQRSAGSRPEEEPEPPRRTRPRRERTPQPVEELTDTGEEYFPPVRLDLPDEPLAPTPSLDELWNEAAAASSPRRNGEQPARGSSRPRRAAPPPREQSRPASRPMWEEDDGEEPPRSAGSRQAVPRSQQRPAPRPAAQEPSRALWEDEEPATPAPKQQQARRPRQPLWEDEEPAAPAPRQQQPRRSRQPLWEDEEPAAPAPRQQQARRSRQPLWEDEEPVVPAPRQQQPRRPQQPLWEDEEPAAPAPRQQQARRPQQPLWEDGEPAAPAPGRQQQARRPQQPLWEDGEPAAPVPGQQQQARRPQQPLWGDEEPAAPASRQQQPDRRPPQPLWKDTGGEQSSARTPAAPAKGGSGRTRDAAAAARLITGMSEEDDSFEGRVVRKAKRGSGGEDSEEPRRRRTPPEEDDQDERSRRRPVRRDEEEDEEPRSRRRTPPEEDDQDERPRRPARREEEDEEERPRRAPRKSREEAEEERPERGEARGRIAAQLNGMKTGLIIRLIVNLLCAAGVVYLALAPGMDLPIPEYFMDNPNQYLWLEVGLVALSALVAGNTVGGGMISLFCLRPNNDSYTAIGVFACLVQGAYMAMRPEMMESYSANLYLPMAVLLLLFNTIGKLILRGRIAASYRLIAKEGAKHTAAVIEDTTLLDKLGKDIIDGEPEIAYFTRASGISAFMDQAFSESKAEDVSKIIAPMTAAAALVMALVSYPFHKDIFTSACVFTAALCITAPIAGVIASNLPITLTNRKLSRWGATLCGYSAVDQLAGVNGVLLRGYDLFPPESVTLHTIKPFNRTPMDEVVADIASVLSQCGSTLTRIFLEMIPDKSVLQEAESFLYEDGKGISAWVNGRRVLIGNRELMKSYGVAIPPKEYEEQYGQGKEILYISNSGQAAGMCVLSYKADKQMRRALELLEDRDIAVCVYTTDPNVTRERICQIYSFPKELVQVMPAALHKEMDRYLDPKAKARAEMIHDGSPSSYVRGVAAARSCDSTLTVETALILLSVVVGFALVTFFAFTGGMPALTWVTIAVYQVFWAAVQLLVALIKG